MSQIVLEELNEQHNYVQYCNILSQLTSLDYNTFTEVDFKNHLKCIKSNPYHKIIVATLNETIIGTITVLIEPKFIHNLSYIAHIEDIVVDMSVRCKGIGRKLVEKAIDISKQYQCYKIILNCAENNLDFYRKFGFKLKECQMALYFSK